MVEKHATALPNLRVLDVSYCLKVSFKGIETLGKFCKALVELRRNSPPSVVSEADETEAMDVSNTIPNIKHLELAYGHFSDHAVDSVLSKCTALRVLDIRGCWNIKLKGNSSVRTPWENDYEEVDSSSLEADNRDEENNIDIGLVDVDSPDDLDDDGYD